MKKPGNKYRPSRFVNVGPPRVLLDIMTQKDMFDNGKNKEPKKKVQELFKWAKNTPGVNVISVVLRIGDVGPGPFGQFQCVRFRDGTDGIKKVPGTLLRRYKDFGYRQSTDLPDVHDMFMEFDQIIIGNSGYFSPFDNVRFAEIISRLRYGVGAEPTFIICGAGISLGIRLAAVALRHNHISVILASDALFDLACENYEDVDMAKRAMDAKGVVSLTTAQITAPPKEPKPRKKKKVRLPRNSTQMHMSGPMKLTRSGKLVEA